MFDQPNTKKQGDVGLGQAIAWFVSNNYTVSIPLTDSQDYDLIVDKGGKISRVQVKTASHKNEYGRFKVDLRVKGGNKSGTGKVKKFDKSKVEALFIFTGSSERYLIPSNEINAVAELVLGEKYSVFMV